MRAFGILAALSALALVAPACGIGSESRGEGPPPATTTQPAAEDATTTEPATEPASDPITAAETHWLEQVESYYERLEDDMQRSGRITHLSMRRSARLYAGCARMLRRAGDPGRLAPARRAAERGCDRLGKAARLLTSAIAASDPGGSVVAGTAEAKQFDRALDGAYEASGNAQYDLQRAVGHAEEIERSLGS